MKKIRVNRRLCLAAAMLISIMTVFIFKDFDMVSAYSEEPLLDRDAAYIHSLRVKSIVDGTAPFDAAAGDGNDVNGNNRIVRCFDSITYNIQYEAYTYDSRDSFHTSYIWFEVELPLKKDKAYFDTDAMQWMTKEAGYSYTVTETATGQILKCAAKLVPSGKNITTIPGSGEFPFVVKVDNMYKGEVVQPIFSAYMDKNPVSKEVPVCAAHGREEYVKAVPEIVTVTSRPGYNIQIKNAWSGAVNASSEWNFNTGNSDAENYGKGTNIKGRMVAFGVTVQMFNPTTNKGLRGIEPLDPSPSNPIKFEIDMSSYFVKKDTTAHIPLDDNKYIPLVWYAGENKIENNNICPNGRAYEDVASFAHMAAPFNKNSAGYSIAANGPLSIDKAGGNTSECWNGGNWSIKQNGRTLEVEISGFEINPNWFPTANAGQLVVTPSDGAYFADKHVGCFSAGEIFVVVPYSDVQTLHGDGSIYLDLKMRDFQAKSVSGTAVTQDLNPSDDGVTREVHLSNPGSWENYVQYGYYDKDGIGWAEDATKEPGGECSTTGNDTLSIGAGVAALWGGCQQR